MRTMMFAGHETTANTLSWTLLELAKHPDMQTKLREEIRAMESVVRERGDAEFTSADFEGMPYTLAVLKVSSYTSPSLVKALTR
jgi:cytochrome P450